MKMLGLALMSLFALNAHAAEVPNCWSESGRDVVDGSFVIHLDTEKMTKEDIVLALDKAKDKNLEAAGFPMVFSPHIYFVTTAADYGVGSYRLSREQLKKAVTEQLSALLSVPGVSAECNGIIRLNPPGMPQ
jgi:hypothetical protein